MPSRLRSVLVGLALTLALAGIACNNPLSSNGPLDSTRRYDTMDAVEGQMLTFLAQDSAHANGRLADYMKSRSEFSDAGVTDDGGAWGRFIDGRYYVFINNRMPEGDISGAPAPPRPTPIAPAPRAVGLAPRGHYLPAATDYRVLNSMSTFFANFQDSVASYLDAAGYHNVPVAFTPAALKNVKFKGILVFHAHGGRFQPPRRRDELYLPSPLFTVCTAERPSKTLDEGDYKDDLDLKRIVYVTARVAGGTAKSAFERRYAITPLFIRNYITFEGINALVYAGCCSGFTSDMYTACFDQGATAYLGWSQEVRDAADSRAARFLFDRLLGNQRVHDPGATASPPQRPFELESVFREMQRRGFARDDEGALLQMEERQSNSADRLVLAPTIEHVEFTQVDARRAILVGFFGGDSARAHVFVGGVETPIRRWSAVDSASTSTDNLEIQLPDTGPGSGGNLVVKVDGVPSNAVPLTEWRGRFTYRETLNPGCTFTLTYDLHLRGDLRANRLSADGTLYRTSRRSITALPDSRCRFAYAGTYSYTSGGKNFSSTYSGAGEFPWTDSLTARNPHFRANVSYVGTDIMVNGRNNYVQLDMTSTSLCRGTRTTVGPDGTDTQPENHSYNGGGLVPHLDLATFAIEGDSLTWGGSDTMFWPRLSPVNPPLGAASAPGGLIGGR